MKRLHVHVAVKEWEGRVVFLHRIVEGPADRSYGIHVAELAGLPLEIIERAREVLSELESERTPEELEAGRAKPRTPSKPRPATPGLPLFPIGEPGPIAALKALEIDRLTPLEALQKLAEWKRKWGGGEQT